ncbi:DUF2971 domain-containing protein [Sinomonas atrocyanea]|uniref:DUF2971 domain-containing protein n=1 Tax=Sinomonas atrocyanea TaxID=37927 RepID=UPI003D967DA7
MLRPHSSLPSGGMQKVALDDLIPPLAPVPSKVSHYTNLDALKGIVTGHVLWASDVYSMNDPSEIRHGFAVLKRVWCEERATSAEPVWLIEYVDRLLDPERLHTLFNSIYVLSACRKGDNLTQWRTYSGTDGWSIGLDTKRPLISKIDDHELEEGHFVVGASWARVVYKEEQQRLLCRISIQNLMRAIRSEADGEAIPSARTENFRFQILMLLASMKNPHYGDEREYRSIVAARDVVPKQRSSRRDDGKVRYLHVAGTTGGPNFEFGHLPIVELRAGPTTSRQDLTEVRELLDATGYQSVHVLSSEIPWRG